MRFALTLTSAFLLAFLALPAAAPAAPPEPSCAAGPATAGGVTYGTPCADVIFASPGVDSVRAGGGDDTIVAAPISAAASCPAGCRLGVGSQTFEGGDGDDVVYGERGNDILRGGSGEDQLFGGIGDDLLQGGPGDDRLAGGFGADSIDGEGDDDYVRGDSTIDRVFDTGGGTDTLSYSTGITPGFGGSVPYAGFPPAGGERGVRLKLGSAGENADNGVAPLGGGVDEVETGAFEVFVGTAFSDYFIGTPAGEVIYGGGGADAFDGGGGADKLIGGADGDSVDGAIETRDTSLVSVGLMTPPGATPYAQLYLVGSGGGDEVTASYAPGAVTFELAAGSFDQSAADAGGCEIESAAEAVCPLSSPLDSLLLAGMGGADTLAATDFPASVGVFATGGEGDDEVTGGGESEDVLVDGPGSGDDVLSGAAGDEAITHNGGADELLGGDGNDLFLSDSVCDGERLDGGPGRDNSSWARFDAGVGANLATGAAGLAGAGEAPSCPSGSLDSISAVEDLEGSSFADALYGDGGPNQLLGHPGADVYGAGGGADSILANSGDPDASIDCGADVDSALVDHSQYGDPAPVNCESVAEADPNNFRTITQLPPPSPEPEEPAPPLPPRPDRRAPQTRITLHPVAIVFTRAAVRQVVFRFASEAGSRFRCRLDRKPYRPCSSPRVYRVKAGRHVFRAFAIDRAGNADPTPALFRFQVRRR